MLDIQQLKAIFKDVPVKMLKESEVLIQEHTYFKFIPIVLKGSLKISRVDDRGNDMFLYYIKEGESCIMSFLGGMHHQQSSLRASAEEDTELMFIPIEKSIDLIRTNPMWQEYIFKLYHQRFEELLGIVNEIAYKRMDERIFQYLIQKQQLLHTNTLNITHQQIADDLSTSRVVVSRLLKVLEQEQKLKLFRNKIELCN